jgi:hypothetical protein
MFGYQVIVIRFPRHFLNLIYGSIIKPKFIKCIELNQHKEEGKHSNPVVFFPTFWSYQGCPENKANNRRVEFVKQ